MKSFDDFLMSLSEDKVTILMDDSVAEVNSILKDSSPDELLPAMIASLSFAISRRTLRLYHEWLSQES